MSYIGSLGSKETLSKILKNLNIDSRLIKHIPVGHASRKAKGYDDEDGKYHKCCDDDSNYEEFLFSKGLTLKEFSKLITEVSGASFNGCEISASFEKDNSSDDTYFIQGDPESITTEERFKYFVLNRSKENLNDNTPKLSFERDNYFGNTSIPDFDSSFDSEDDPADWGYDEDLD